MARSAVIAKTQSPTGEKMSVAGRMQGLAMKAGELQVKEEGKLEWGKSFERFKATSSSHS